MLIHINPGDAAEVYDALCTQQRAATSLSGRVLQPDAGRIPYRGHADRLFKRDFAGEILDRHPDLQLSTTASPTGAIRHFPQDDITWFLLEKARSLTMLTLLHPLRDAGHQAGPAARRRGRVQRLPQLRARARTIDWDARGARS